MGISTRPLTREGVVALRDVSGDGLEVDTQEELGQGTESMVVAGTLHGHRVAVKRVKISGYDCLQRFKRECGILAKLSPHPAIACPIGFDPTPSKRAFVLPLMDNGDLGTLIHDKGVLLGGDLALVFALQAADALAHVHANDVIHKDVKSSNLLVTGDWKRCVLSDFGLAENVQKGEKTDAQARADIIHANRGPTGGIQRVRIVGTLVSLAPEVLGNQPHSTASDVYSWAVLCNELLSGTVPYSDSLMDNPKPHTILDQSFNQAELMQAIAKGLRPATSPDAPAWATTLVGSAWSGEPSQRPTAAAIAAEMRSRGVAGEGFAPKGHRERVGGVMGVEVGASEATDEVVSRGADVVRSWGPGVPHAAATFLAPGRRGFDKMEDFTTLERLDGGTLLFGVFDGHGGPEVSRHCSLHLKRSFLAAAGGLGPDGSPGDALQGALQALESEVMGMKEVTSGTTALTGCLVGEDLWLANIGDGRATASGTGGGAERLTVDQNCEVAGEVARIEAAGGRIEGGRVNARISVTRSVGDRQFKPPLSSEAAVSRHACGGIEWVVAASDGLWETVSDEEAMGVVRDTVKVPDLLAQRLVMHAIDPGGSRDNVSVVVLVLGGARGVEQVYDGAEGGG